MLCFFPFFFSMESPRGQCSVAKPRDLFKTWTPHDPGTSVELYRGQTHATAHPLVLFVRFGDDSMTVSAV